MSVRLAPLLLAALALPTAAGADTRPAKRAKPTAPAAAPAFAPYDPDRRRTGARPGSIDLGNGTELSVSGRVRLDYDRRR